MKRIILIGLCIAGAAVLVSGCGSKKAKEAQQKAEQALADSLAAVAAEESKAVQARIDALPEEPVFDIITNMGTIKVKLYSGTPKHRENFAKLAFSKYYDGIIFHRVINGFMIQGGDPFTRDTSAAAVAKYGQGGPGYTIPAEFVPEYTHKKGALAAARRGDVANPKKESSGSQFYIVQDANACAQLDGAYTVFGETVSGLDVIDRIAQVATDQRDKPLMDVRIKTIKLDESCLPKVQITEEVASETEKDAE